jgi:hypothetical protein
LTELAAWALFPLAALAVCTGVGLLAARIARAELEPAAIPPLGFAASIVLLGPLCATGAGEAPALALLLAAALTGFVVNPPRALRPGPGAAAGLATYALYIAPVALSGSATFLGYNLLNDTAIHLALVDWIGDHGSRWLGGQPPSSYIATIDDYVQSRYPLGSHELLAALRPLGGVDAALVYQPFLALSAALAAAAVYTLLPRGRYAALAAFAALASQLTYSFALQGGIKEITFVACLATAAALWRHPALMALPAAALYAIYGVYALPWLVPLALVALVLTRPPARVSATAAAVFLAGIAVLIPGSIHYWRHGHEVITSGQELGPLPGPLKLVQVTGVWLEGDYRFTPAHAWITYLLAALVLALAAAGVVGRARGALLLLLVPAFVAWAATTPISSPYIDAKLLAILSPAVVLAACLGVAALAGRPGVAIAAAVVAAGAILVSDALAYRDAFLAPMDRLGELSAIDRRFAGRGPILVNEFEEYVKHFMRRSRGSDPYEKWTAGRVVLSPGGVRLVKNDPFADLARMQLGFVERWPLIAVRRSPLAGPPPSNYERVFHGRFYDVWKRGGGPRERVPGRRHCRNRATFDIASHRPLPPGFYVDPRRPSRVDARKGGSVFASASTDAGTYRFWIQGTAYRRSALLVDDRRVGTVFGANRPSQWIDVGVLALQAGPHKLELRRPRRSLRPGDSRADLLGPVLACRPEPR